MSLPIQIVVGGPGPYDPAVGATAYTNPLVVGDFFVSSAGYGPLPYADYKPRTGGGFDLLNYAFEADEIYFVTLLGVTDAATSISYSNGFNYARVMAAMLPRLGFRQPTLAGYNVLNTSNTSSLSGRYFDDFHALVRARNIKDTDENPNLSDADFNAVIDSLKRGVVMRCLNGVLNVKEQIERCLVYEPFERGRTTVTNQGRFVGFEIEVAPDDSYSVQIESAQLMFDSDVTFNLYLFKDGKKSPLWSQQVSAVAGEATVVNLSDLVLNYIGQTTKGSVFYFGYFQKDLGSAKAIKEVPEWAETKLFEIESFFSTATEDGNYFDREQKSCTYDTFGLNLEISSFRDHTNAIVRKAALFDELAGLQMNYVVLERIVYATRINGTSDMLKDNIIKAGLQLEMLGAIPTPDSPQITGLKSRIDRELKRVRDAFYKRPKGSTVNFAEW